jgi:hypothetical protein
MVAVRRAELRFGELLLHGVDDLSLERFAR